ncbi:DUF4430 domain-containing protein [Bacillus cytotoxicus]
MNMMKWFFTLVLSFSLLVGCGQNETKPKRQVASKQTEQKEVEKQAEKQDEPKQEEQKQPEQPQSNEEQLEEKKQAEEQSSEKQKEQKEQPEVKQEEQKEQTVASEEQPLEQQKGNEEKAESKQQEQPEANKEPEIVHEPKETPKQEQSAPQPVVPKHDPKTDPQQQKQQVTISVKGHEGYLLGATKVDVQEGDTVYKVLRRTGLDVDASGFGNSIYVKGINDLYEKDVASTSGWKYRVNGTFPNRSAGAVTVKPGDKIEWVYVLN